MGAILSAGVGSGLDITGLVGQLVAAEGQPQTVRLDTEEARLQTKLSAIGSLRGSLDGLASALDALKNLDTFQGRSVDQSTPDFVSVFATKDASFGSYEIEVQQLATAQRLVSDPQIDANTAVGTGTLTLTIGASGFTVEIDDVISEAEPEPKNTLNGIRDAINNSEFNTGIYAAVVTGVDGARLILSSTETGATNQIVVTASGGDGGLVALTYDPVNSITNLTELEAAVDASVLIEGISVTSPTNTVSGAMEGVEISLLDVNSPGETTVATIGFDRDAAKEAVSKLVENYNNLIDMVTEATRYDPESGTAGPLLGDAGLRNILFQLRRELGQVPTGALGQFATLSDLGISIEFDGKFSIDSSKLDGAFDTSFQAVGAFFADADTGIAGRLDALLEPYLQTGGVLDSRQEGLNSSIEIVNEQREALQLRLVSLEQRLFRQFNALDTLLAELQSTSGFLQQQLDNLPGFGNFNDTRRN